MKIIVNSREIAIEHENTGANYLLNGHLFSADIITTSESGFHVLMDTKSFNAEVLETNASAKEMTIRINGNKYTVSIRDKYDDLLHQLGMDKMLATKVNDLKAPMPGLVLDILVNEGQHIKKGENLVVLEAMKMENNLKAMNDATVKKVRVAKGNRVEKNEILIELG